jgi:hypothetical protein
MQCSTRAVGRSWGGCAWSVWLTHRP